MPTTIVALLIVAALVLLVRTWLSGRRDRDPASSVHSFQRAMTAMGHEATGGPRDDDHGDDDRAAPDTPVGRR